MNSPETLQINSSLATLRRFARKRAPVERCELCSVELDAEHQHLVELANRKLLCACDACGILFSDHSSRRYRRVPKQIRFLRDLQLTDQQWEALMIPINMAFFFHNSVANKVVAFYPSPAGAAESLLDLQSWDEIVEQNPCLREMQSDVEALLVNRIERISSQPEYYRVPIDECYKLVGLIRTNWRGLSGGIEAWQEIETFFADLKHRAIR